jgi:hypothetical protein
LRRRHALQNRPKFLLLPILAQPNRLAWTGVQSRQHAMKATAILALMKVSFVPLRQPFFRTTRKHSFAVLTQLMTTIARRR